MSWTFAEINADWFGGNYISLDPEEVVRAFSIAEEIRGREWVLGSEIDPAFLSFPGVGKRGGYQEFLRVYWFGTRAQLILGLPGSKELLAKLSTNDSSSESELTAIHLLRSHLLDTEAEIEPAVINGNRRSKPDFRIRKRENFWTYVEVTKLNPSLPFIHMQQFLQRIAEKVISISHPFLLEIWFWRESTQAEVNATLEKAVIASESSSEYRIDNGDYSTILVKLGDPSLITPVPLPDDDRPRMAIAQSIIGPDQPNRQVIVRIPFADQRAEDILDAEAKQLPKDECGLVMVDVTAQQTAFTSWAKRIPQRFVPSMRTRVAGVILFAFPSGPSGDGLGLLPTVKLISNPYASKHLPNWIKEAVNSIGPMQITAPPPVLGDLFNF